MYLDVFLYDRIIMGSSSEIFGNLLKFSENVRKRLSGFWKTFTESLEISGKCSEIVKKVVNSWLLVDKEFVCLCSLS